MLHSYVMLFLGYVSVTLSILPYVLHDLYMSTLLTLSFSSVNNVSINE